MKETPYFCSSSGVLMVTVSVVGSLALVQRVDWRGRWLIGPSILIAGSLIPALLRHDGPTALGVRTGRLWQTARLTCIAGMVLAGLGLPGVLALGCTGIELPLRASMPEGKWVQWILFQFLYAALPEELFFRGYLMGSIMRPLGSAMDKSILRTEHAAILLSAAVFALAHALILGNAAAVVTFVPGLAFAWLFAKTGSLAGPILLHGSANVGYGLIGMHFG